MSKYLNHFKYGFLIIVIVLIILFAVKFVNYGDKGYAITDGLVTYSMERDIPLYSVEEIEETDIFTVSKIIFKNDKDKIYGQLWLPLDSEDVPAILFFPAAGGTKENEKYLAEKMVAEGYAFFAIDQRGIGETSGKINSIDADLDLMDAGEEPIGHKMIYDGLLAFDVLRNHKNIDKNKIVVAGSSMGGRTAMIIGALDDRVKGVLIFSSAGLNMPSNLIFSHYFYTIDPDNYVNKITSELVMFHSEKDSVIPYSYAEKTFGLANEPKQLIKMPEPCDHGYCEEIDEELYEVLENIFI
ncbi:MAG: alpha/beta fold hydrolase [archaeon]